MTGMSVYSKLQVVFIFMVSFLQRSKSCGSRAQNTWQGEGHWSVQSFFISDHAHVSLIESEREAFGTTVHFEHDFDSHYEAHNLFGYEFSRP